MAVRLLCGLFLHLKITPPNENMSDVFVVYAANIGVVRLHRLYRERASSASVAGYCTDCASVATAACGGNGSVKRNTDNTEGHGLVFSRIF